MAQIKFQVLAIGEYQTGKGRTGTDWHRRSLQVFIGQVAGQIPYYATKEELDALKDGMYTAEVEPTQGDRGAIEFRISKVQQIAGIKQP